VENTFGQGHVFVGVFFFLSYEKIGVSVFGVCVGQSKVESRRKILCFKISCDIK